MEDDEDISVTPGQINSFKEIVMLQLNKVTSFSNTEFRGGFYSEVTGKDGRDKEIYVQDTREVYGNAVYTLALLLYPRFNKNMKKHFGDYKTKIDEIKKEFMDASSPDEDIILGEAFYESDEDKILLETFKMKKLKYNKLLFSKISILLSELNYLGMSGGTF